MDDDNPAVTRQLQINPALLEEVGTDPTVIPIWARKMYFIQQAQMHARMREANAPLGAKQAFLDHLAKVGDVGGYAKANAAAAANPGAGFSINFVFPNDSGSDKSKQLPKVEVVENTGSEHEHKG